MKFKKILLFLIIFLVYVDVIYSEDTISLYQKAIEAKKNKNYQKAVTIFESILPEIDNKDINKDFKCNLFMQFSDSLYYTGEYHKSISYLLLAYELQPENIDLIKRIALGYCKIRNYDKSLEFLNKGNMIYPNNINILFDLGNIYKLKGDYKNALESFEKARKISKNNDKIYLSLATIYGDTISPYYNLKTAIEYSEKAVELLPALSNRLVRLSLLSRQGNMNDALNELEKIEKEIESEPDRYYEHFMIGLIYNRIKDYKKAIIHLHMALPKYAHLLKDHSEFREIRLMDEFDDLNKRIDQILTK